MYQPVLSPDEISNLSLRQLQELRRELVCCSEVVEAVIDARASALREPSPRRPRRPSGRACGRTHPR